MTETTNSIDVMFLSNGLVAAFDKEDEQVPELQGISWLRLWLKAAEDAGFPLERFSKLEIVGGDRLLQVSRYKGKIVLGEL